jgi:hypothetical protein
MKKTDIPKFGTTPEVRLLGILVLFIASVFGSNWIQL